MSPFVVIDPGHGSDRDSGHSPSYGTGGGGLFENGINLRIAQRVAAHLGQAAVLTRRDDRNPGLSDRARLAGRYRAGAFVSIRAREQPSDGHGAEVWIHERDRDASGGLGRSIHHELSSVGQARGVFSGDLAVLTPELLSDTPGTLVEVDYPHHPANAWDPQEAVRLDRIGGAIARGVERFLGHGGMAMESGPHGSSEQRPMVSALAASIPWDGDWDITMRLPKSRTFTVSRSSIEVESRASFNFIPHYYTPPSTYTITLHKVGTLWDSTISAATFPVGSSATFRWNDLSSGDYYLEFYYSNTNPDLRLQGHVWVRY